MRHAVGVSVNNGKRLVMEITFDNNRVFRLQFDDENVEERWRACFSEFIEDCKVSVNGFSRYESINMRSFNVGTRVMSSESGWVQNAVYTKNGMKCSVKTVLSATLNSTEAEYIKRCHNSMINSTCPYLAKTLKGFFDENIHFVQPELPHVRLADVMNKTSMHIARIRFYACELILAIDAVHKCNFVHNEINPETIFVSDSGNILLTVPLGMRMSYTCGYNYYSPEVLQKMEPTFASDFWSYGVLLFALAFGDAPFYDPDPTTVCKKVINEDPTFPVNTFPELVTLIKQLLVKDTSRRLCDVENTKASTFFETVDFDKFQRMEVTLD